MDLDIRRHIINNFKGDNTDTLRSAIDESIKENDEITLPGMGVFLEIIWSDASDEMKNEMLKIIENRIKREQPEKNQDSNN
ncbi:MAG: small acid-soluble spore protein SspI [Bacilli bacterium]|nr:small acid-soluble spore protein SspI [Bacilli bacterium]